MSNHTLTNIILGAKTHLEYVISTYHLPPINGVIPRFNIVIASPTIENTENLLELERTNRGTTNVELPYMALTRDSIVRNGGNVPGRKMELLLAGPPLDPRIAQTNHCVPVLLTYTGEYYAKRLADCEDFIEFVTIELTDGFTFEYTISGDPCDPNNINKLKANYQITSLGKGSSYSASREYYAAPITLEIKGWLVGSIIKSIKRILVINDRIYLDDQLVDTTTITAP